MLAEMQAMVTGLYLVGNFNVICYLSDLKTRYVTTRQPTHQVSGRARYPGLPRWKELGQQEGALSTAGARRRVAPFPHKGDMGAVGKLTRKT